MAAPSLHKVVERVYDAALQPERWEEVSQLLKEAFDSPVAGLFVQSLMRKTGTHQQGELVGLLLSDWSLAMRLNR